MESTKKGTRRTSQNRTTNSNKKNSTSATPARKTGTNTNKRKTTVHRKKPVRRKSKKYEDLLETIFASEGLPRILRLALGFLAMGFLIYGYYKYTMYEDGGLLIGKILIDFDFLSKIIWILLYTALVFFLGYKYSERKR